MDKYEIDNLAHSAFEEAISFGLNHDVFVRYITKAVSASASEMGRLKGVEADNEDKIEQLETEIADLKRQLEEANSELAVEKLNLKKLHSVKDQLREAQAREAGLREFSLDQWWYSELKSLLDFPEITDDVKRVVIGVIPNLIDQIHALPHDDTALREYRDAVIEECAAIAGNSCLVPPDGGTPTVEEAAVSEEAARRIRKLKSTSVPAGYTEEELERDNPYNQWVYE